MAKAREEVEQFITDSRGKRKAVILPIEQYEKYKQLMEDLADLRAMDERKDEPTVPWEEVKQRLRADSLLQD
jgi:prevent-host-death family protein